MRSNLKRAVAACAVLGSPCRAQSGPDFDPPLSPTPADLATSGQGGAGAEGKSQSVEMAKTLANPIGNLISVPWWTVPLNGVVQQLVKLGKRPVAFSLGGRDYAERPAEGPDWGLRFAVIFLFPK